MEPNYDDALAEDSLFLLDLCPKQAFPRCSPEDNLAQKWLEHLCTYEVEDLNDRRMRNIYISHLCTALIKGKLYGPFLKEPPCGKLEKVDFTTQAPCSSLNARLSVPQQRMQYLPPRPPCPMPCPAVGSGPCRPPCSPSCQAPCAGSRQAASGHTPGSPPCCSQSVAYPAPSAPCPPSSTPCSTPPAPCPTTSAPCPTPTAPCPTPTAPCPTSSAPCPPSSGPCPPPSGPCPPPSGPCPTPSPAPCPAGPSMPCSAPCPAPCAAPCSAPPAQPCTCSQQRAPYPHGPSPCPSQYQPCPPAVQASNMTMGPTCSQPCMSHPSAATLGANRSGVPSQGQISACSNAPPCAPAPCGSPQIPCACPPVPCPCAAKGLPCTCGRKTGGSERKGVDDEEIICNYLMQQLNFTPDFLTSFDATLTSFMDLCKGASLECKTKAQRQSTSEFSLESSKQHFLPNCESSMVETNPSSTTTTQETRSSSPTTDIDDMRDDINKLLAAIMAELSGDVEPGSNDYLDRELARYKGFLMANSRLTTNLKSLKCDMKLRNCLLLSLQNDLVKLLNEHNK